MNEIEAQRIMNAEGKEPVEDRARREERERCVRICESYAHNILHSAATASELDEYDSGKVSAARELARRIAGGE